MVLGQLGQGGAPGGSSAFGRGGQYCGHFLEIADDKLVKIIGRWARGTVGGALSAIAVQFVSPDSFTMFLSISLLVGIVVGGVGTLWGALFGALFIMFVPSLAEEISKAAPWAIYGAALIVFMFVMPGGVMGLLHGLHRRWLARAI